MKKHYWQLSPSNNLIRFYGEVPQYYIRKYDHDTFGVNKAGEKDHDEYFQTQEKAILYVECEMKGCQVYAACTVKQMETMLERRVA